MAGGAGVASVGLRRRSPPSPTMTGRITLTRSGATVGELRPSATKPAPFPGGEGGTAATVTDRWSPACSASRRACRAPGLRASCRSVPRARSMTGGNPPNRGPGVGTAQRGAPASPHPSNTKLQSLSASRGLVVSFALSSDSFTSPQSTPMVGSLNRMPRSHSFEYKLSTL